MSATPFAPPTGTLVQIDPREIVVGDNVRHDTRIDKAFVASIRERGVLVPIVGYVNDDGQFVVLYGQRRTLASVEAGRDTIPAYVVEGQDDADRLVDQMAENDHRATLTTTERARGFEQLAGFGLSVAQIVKRTAAPKSTVKAALSVAASEVASDALTKYQGLTIEQAAGIAEFEDDEEIVKRLLGAAENGGFKHTLQRYRDEREDREATEAFAAQLREQGLTVIDEPGYGDAKIATLTSLVDVADGSDIGAEEHAAVCPGHAVYPAFGYEWEEPADGAPEGTRGKQVRVLKARAVCTDYPAHGHKRAYSVGGGTTKKSAEDMTEEEREAAKAARRDVIDSNKAWASAETVRKEWIREFLTRKSVPRNAHTFIALTFATCSNLLSDFRLNDLYANLIGIGSDPSERRSLAEKATADRAQVLSLGWVLAGYENSLSKDSWRRVSGDTTRYLEFLESNGYELSTVEKRAAGHK